MDMKHDESIEVSYFLLAGGKIRCLQCSATSKRSGLQCRAPAMRTKRVCKAHGGASPGPRTAEGRLRCAAAKTVHGLETRAAREQRTLGLVNLAKLELQARQLGLIQGPLTSGRKAG